MQKYALICLIEKLDEGTEFSFHDWPSHVTIVSNFVVDWESTALFEKLTSLLAKHKATQVTAGDDEYFGDQKQIKVTVLNMNDELVRLHKDIVNLLKSVGAVFDEPEYLDDGYRAHITVTKNSHIKRSDKVNIDAITIVDMFPQEDIGRRKLLRTIKLPK